MSFSENHKSQVLVSVCDCRFLLLSSLPNSHHYSGDFVSCLVLRVHSACRSLQVLQSTTYSLVVTLLKVCVQHTYISYILEYPGTASKALSHLFCTMRFILRSFISLAFVSLTACCSITFSFYVVEIQELS